MMKSLFIVDASGYLYRSYHAIQNLTNKKGESTNALYGFIRSLLKLQKDFSASYLVAVFDGPKSIEKREKIYPKYKAQRAEMPEDLRYQIRWAQEFCDLSGIPKLVIPQVEADDTMGSVASWASEKGTEVFLCTSDKDLCQLVNETTFILNTHKDNLILDKKGVENAFGVPPDKMIDFLAITGDSSDNIPGLPGFGPKTAAALLQKFSSLEEILSHPEKVSGKKKQETIVQMADLARLSKKLVTIETEVEFPKESDFFKLKTPSENQKLKDFYTYMNFSSLLKEAGQKTESRKTEKEELDYKLVDDEKSLLELVEILSCQKHVCFDTETTHKKPMKAELVGIGFSIKEKQAWYVPVNGSVSLEKVIQAIKPLFEQKSIGFFGHNVKYDWHVLMNYGIQIKNICFDTILASYLLNSHSRQHSLDSLSLEIFGKVKISIEDLIGKGKKAISMESVPIEKVAKYCCEDADYTFRIKEILEKRLIERKLEKLFFSLELPLLEVLAKMERNGIFIETAHLEKMRRKISSEILELGDEIQQLAKEPFNVNSPKQLSFILFEKMGIPAPKKTATGLSTSARVLEFLQNEHPIAKKVLEYRSLEKLRSTYIDALPEEVNPKTHRIHPTFNQSVAATGRLSCQDPNLQNIPVRTETGRQIREAFRPEKGGWSYLSADYSQIELRLLAHFSEDKELIKAFQNNEDIHAFTASLMLNIPIEKVTKEQRYHAKAVNFGIIYGQQAFGLSRELNISIEEAAYFIKTYFERYPHIRDFLEHCKKEAEKTGKATTLLGRERSIPEIHSKNKQIRAAAERLAINTPLQGTSADLIKLAMLSIDKKLSKEGRLGFMILQIHDALIFEIPHFEIPAIESIVKEEMEQVHQLKVPLIVDITVGKNWKEC